MAGRWADLPIIRDTESGIAAIEREQMTKPRPLDIEEPVLHQPSSQYVVTTTESFQRDHFVVDDVTQQTVKLVEYCHQLRALIQNAKQQSEALESSDVNAGIVSSIPPVPIHREQQLKNKQLKPVPFLQKDIESAFVRGVGPIPSEVNHVTCRRLLRRSVAAVCAQASFDCCMESCLETLSDVAHDYIIHMTHMLRSAADNQANNKDGQAFSFLDIICQVFYEMGIGNPTALHEYYQSRLTEHQIRLMQTCRQLQQELCEIVQSDGTQSVIREASVSRKEGVSEDIRFPSAEDTDDIGYADVLSLDQLDATTSQDCDNVMAVEDDIGSAAIVNSGIMTRSRLGIAGKTDNIDRQVHVDHSDTQTTS